MYTIKFTGEFKRQMKLCERRGYDMEPCSHSSWPSQERRGRGRQR